MRRYHEPRMTAMQVSDVSWGYLPSADIPAALKALRRIWTPSWALISTIDSESTVAQLTSVRRLRSELERSFSVVDDTDVAVEYSLLRDFMFAGEMFNGFDELWLCESAPRPAKPLNIKLTLD